MGPPYMPGTPAPYMPGVAPPYIPGPPVIISCGSVDTIQHIICPKQYKSIVYNSNNYKADKLQQYYFYKVINLNMSTNQIQWVFQQPFVQFQCEWLRPAPTCPPTHVLERNRHVSASNSHIIISIPCITCTCVFIFSHKPW
jgi:hypothetical protein